MSLTDILIAVAGGIGKGSLSKVGANIVENLPKLISSQNINDLEEENKFYCPFCGTSIKHGRVVCLGCKNDVIYGKTQEEEKGEIVLIFFIGGGFITYLILVKIPKLLNFIFNWNVSSRFGLDIFPSSCVWMFVGLCLLILFAYLEKKASLPQRIRCRRYCKDTKKYIYKDVEY